LDATLDSTPIRISQDFFDHPAELPIIEAAQEPFKDWLRSFGLSDAEVDSVTRRLGAYFTFALHREWAKDPSFYRPIEQELDKADTPFAKADAKERGWLRNAAFLQRQTEEPIFDEAFGLNQVYVPLRAYWIERAKGTGRFGAEPVLGGPDREEVWHVVDLASHLRDWVYGADKNDAIRVVCGGPGCGKTSFAKMFAAVLAKDTDLGILYIPLHRLEFEGKFRDAIRNFVAGDLEILPHDPLDQNEEHRRLVMFVDGLDELAMSGRVGQEAASDFADELDRAVDRINDRNLRLQVILGGREVVIQASERTFKQSGQILHVLPYFVPGRGEVRRPTQVPREQFTDPGHFLAQDQRDLWWANYGLASGRGYSVLPDPLKKPALDEITGQPLLNYLLALSFDRGKIQFGHDFNLNDLYADLLRSLWYRRWGERQLPDVEKLEQAEFEEILEEVGLAAWHTGERGVSIGRIADLCDQAGLTDRLRAFEKGAEKGATSLLAAFYFRQAKRAGGERTFEFTHKSFGEYLAARRLVATFGVVAGERARNRQNRKLGWDIETALIEWTRIAGPAAIDRDLFAFVERELALKNNGAASVNDWHATLVELMNDQLRNGLPMTKIGLDTYHEMARQAQNAEEALLVSVYGCATVLNSSGPSSHEPIRSRISWPGGHGLRDMLGRLMQNRGFGPLALRCLGWLEAGGQALVGAIILGPINLKGTNLEGALFFHTSLFDANLEAAVLSGAHLEAAMLHGANLQGADLRRARLEDAKLPRSDLKGANLSDAFLMGALLTGADLAGADLAGADLEGANLQGANLQGANLDKAKSLRGVTIDPEWLGRLGIDPERLKEKSDEPDEPPAQDDETANGRSSSRRR